MVYNAMASAILNDVYTGLRGLHSNIALSVEQLEDEIPQVRLSIIKQQAYKGILNEADLLYSINCISVDCKPLDRCPECVQLDTNCPIDGIPHFQIPNVINEAGIKGIKYVGSTDRLNSFTIYTNPRNLKNRTHKRFFKEKPYVYIDMVPNTEGFLDGYIFNAPMIKMISVVGMFKDLRDLLNYNCCRDIKPNMSSIDLETQRTLTDLKIKYYRQLQFPLINNNQTAR